VVLADIDGHAAEAVVQALGEAGQEALAVVTDVSQPEDTEHMAQAVIERFGRIYGLINNAALFQRPVMSRVPCSFDAPGHLFLQGERKPNLQPSDPESE
jgi:NAD(P)-dependent dehydrogenase (short-subunit alcohol dehydrogenase family)